MLTPWPGCSGLSLAVSGKVASHPPSLSLQFSRSTYLFVLQAVDRLSIPLPYSVEICLTCCTLLPRFNLAGGRRVSLLHALSIYLCCSAFFLAALRSASLLARRGSPPYAERDACLWRQGEEDVWLLQRESVDTLHARILRAHNYTRDDATRRDKIAFACDTHTNTRQPLRHAGAISRQPHATTRRSDTSHIIANARASNSLIDRAATAFHRQDASH
jgi:hypothetical protein